MNTDPHTAETKSYQPVDFSRLRKPELLAEVLKRLHVATISENEARERKHAILRDFKKEKKLHSMMALCFVGLAALLLYHEWLHFGVRGLAWCIAGEILFFGAAFYLTLRLDPFFQQPWGRKLICSFSYQSLDRRVMNMGRMCRIAPQDGVEELIEAVLEFCPEARFECEHVVSAMVPKRFWRSRITMLRICCGEVKFAVDPRELYKKEEE